MPHVVPHSPPSVNGFEVDVTSIELLEELASGHRLSGMSKGLHRKLCDRWVDMEGPRAGALCACNCSSCCSGFRNICCSLPYLCRLCGHIIVLPVHGKHIDMRPSPAED